MILKVRDSMNRSQRRGMKKSNAKVERERVINIKVSELEKIKKDAADSAANLAFFLMLAIPAMVIHDEYPKLMKRVEKEKTRTERFVDLCLDLYDSFEKGYVSLEDLHKCLWEEAGVKIEREAYESKTVFEENQKT